MSLNFTELQAHDLTGRATSFKKLVEGGMEPGKAAGMSGLLAHGSRLGHGKCPNLDTTDEIYVMPENHYSGKSSKHFLTVTSYHAILTPWGFSATER